jgi:peptide/nickel transport system substrate-binding protein
MCSARPRGRLLRAVAATAAIGVLAACASDDSASPGQGQAARPESVERLRLPGGDWGYPSPFAYVRGPGLVNVNFLFDTLLWKDSTGEAIPWLASQYQRSPDGLEWRFTLRDDVRWHDGQALTADDVVFTFEYLTKGAGATAPGIFGRIDVKEVVAESPTVAVIRLNSPQAGFEISVAGRIPVIPRHIWSDVADPAKLRDPKALMGSGPYKMQSFDEASGNYLFVANESYFMGTPYVRRLEFVTVSDSLLALQRGDIDAGSPGSEEGMPEEALKPFETDRFEQLSGPGEWSRVLHFNMTKGFPYDNRDFRQAVAYAVDRKDMVKRILFDRGEPGSLGGLAPSHQFAATGLPAYDRDLAKARSLLDAAGLRDVNGDGVRDLPDGQPFKPELQTSSRFSSKTAELTKEYLREVGIDVTIRSLDSAAADDNAAKGNYEMALVGYGGLGGEPDLLRTRYSAQVRSASFNRVHGYQNAAFEELAARQLRVVDTEERKKAIQDMQRLLAEDVPTIPLYVPTRVHIYPANSFDAWYYTPGGVFGGYPGTINKHAFVTGKKVGF